MMMQEIIEFGEKMEETMKKNENKKGDSYKIIPLHELENGLLHEVEEWRYSENIYDAMQECIDIANYCMMLFHRYKQEAGGG